MFLTLVTVAVLASVATADPAVVLTNGFLSSPLTAAYVGSASAPLIAPVGTVSNVASLASVPVPAVAGTLPYTAVSDYRYSYGSALSYQDYAPVVSSAALQLPYQALPYAYAADWYYRK